ncbi:MAG: YgiT-type zinc finger protein [Chloroflexota bacterium]
MVVFENVPARVCQQCGEKFFDAEVHKEMESMAQSKGKPSARISVDVVNFKDAIDSYIDSTETL